MKYFTKDYYKKEQLSKVLMNLAVSNLALFRNEIMYQNLYQKMYEKFENDSKSDSLYHDTAEDLRRLDLRINDPSVSEEEREFRLILREAHENLYKKRERKVYKFDERMCALQFKERNKRLIELYKNLPPDILRLIADIRVFALGVASEKVFLRLQPYCDALKRKTEKISKQAFAETDSAERYLTEEIGLNNYEEYVLFEIEKRDGDVYLKLDDGICLNVKDGIVTEGGDRRIHPFDATVPNCPWSRIIHAELHRVDNKFELQFLMESGNAVDKREVWNLTVIGTDIIVCGQQGGEDEYDDYDEYGDE